MEIEKLQDSSFDSIKRSRDEEIEETRQDIERSIETFKQEIRRATRQGLFRTGYIEVQDSSSDAVLGYFENEGLYVRREKILFFDSCSIDLSWDPRDIKKLSVKRPKILEWWRKTHWINYYNFMISMISIVIVMLAMIPIGAFIIEIVKLC